MEKDHGQLCSGGVATPADAALMIGGNAKQDCPVCIISEKHLNLLYLYTS